VIVLFILVMQFLWKYVDDLMGKGLEWYVLLELMTYATASFVPLRCRWRSCCRAS
jgi:lipopolysaccharide export system permease protein